LSDRYDRGLAKLQMVAGTDRPAVLDTLAALAPDLARYLIEFVYGDVYAGQALTLRRRELAAVAALSALGNAEPQLRFHIRGALNAGCTQPEVDEALARAGDTLEPRDREIAEVAALTAAGTPARPELQAHIERLLDAGGPPAEVIETILLMAVFAGFPAALNGIAAAADVFADRGLAP
jgi:alkylhydroperoxidase/carboxymuconolactone decarboxylase family protein YurZ